MKCHKKKKDERDWNSVLNFFNNKNAPQIFKITKNWRTFYI
jgi:hypothetical protein